MFFGMCSDSVAAAEDGTCDGSEAVPEVQTGSESETGVESASEAASEA